MSGIGDEPRPTGTVTFLFSDIVGSTRRWALEPDAMADATSRHDAIVRDAVARHSGYVFATGGDSFAIAFSTPDDAIDLAMDVQARLRAESWPTSEPLTVRIGINLGAATERGGDYFGPPVNLAARVESVAHGGQIVMTDAVARTSDRPRRDLGEHELKDIADLQRLWQAGDGEYPPLRTLERVRHSLPTLRTPTFGREELVRDLRQALGDHRLVTLTGAGGAGKTRTAVETATAAVHEFADGTYFADLTDADQSGSVWPTVLAALNLIADSDARGRVIDFLSQRRVLLVLDNCEQVIDDAADVVDDLLEQTTGTTILATSREALDVDGERVVRVPALDAASAIRLFIDRAEAAGGSVDGMEDAAAIEDVCAQLDGMPLAIELAAARCAAMPPAEIARRLDERFTLLGGGRGRRRRRQQTLAGVMEWSHELLTDTERMLFRRLAVFAGTFERDDVVAVAHVDGEAADRLLDSLVAKSLIEPGRHRGVATYRLLESIRLYALDRLYEAGELAELREMHATHFGLSTLGGPIHDLVPTQDAAERSIRRAANLDAAIAHLAQTERRSEAAALVAGNWFSLMSTGRLRGFRDLFLESHDDAPEPIQLAILSCAAAWMITSDFEVVAVILEAAEAAEERFTIPLSHQVRSARAYATLFSEGADAALNLVGDPGSGEPDRQWLVGLSDVYLVVATCRYVAGDLDGSLEAARLSAQQSVHTPSGLIAAASAAWMLAMQGRHVEARQVVADLPPPSPGSWSHVEPLGRAFATFGSVPDEQVARAVLDVHGQLDPGVVSTVAGDLLIPFIDLRLRIGHRDRARALLDDVLTYQMLLPYLLVVRRADVWPEAAWEDRFLESHTQSVLQPREAERRRRATQQRLAEEVEFWEAEIAAGAAQAEMGVPE